MGEKGRLESEISLRVDMISVSVLEAAVGLSEVVIYTCDYPFVYCP